MTNIMEPISWKENVFSFQVSTFPQNGQQEQHQPNFGINDRHGSAKRD